MAWLVAAAALLAAPASAQEAAPVAAPAAAAPGCAAERTRLEAEHVAVKGAIADIALGRDRHRQRPRVSAGDVGRAAAGTAAAILLPFGIGALASAGIGASGRQGKGKARTPPPPAPDVPALIERQQAIEARLAALAQGCRQ